MGKHASTCKGCLRVFPTTAGYISHIQQTRDIVCRDLYNHKIRRRQAKYASTSSDSSDSSDSAESTSRENVEPIAFQGDLFGTGDDYVNDDFGQEEEADVMMNISQEGSNAEDVPDDSDEEAELGAELEGGWEAFRENAPADEPVNDQVVADDPEAAATAAELEELEAECEADATAEARSREEILLGDGHGITPKVIIKYLDQYPDSKAGQPVSHQETSDSQYQSTVGTVPGNPYAPFKSRKDWEVARWAKLRGQGSTAFNDLLGIDGVREALNLSYKNADELNSIIDTQLPGRPKFRRHEVVIQNEAMELYSRDVMECLRALWGDPEFADDLIFEPQRQYSDDDQLDRLFHGMETGNWWWQTQRKVERETKKTNCTIVPIIISSDKTQLTQFRNKSAYPVYITIGNLPKHIRRKPSRQGQILLAYLPTSKLDHIKNIESRRRCAGNLFHLCMSHILRPLENAGRTGVLFVSGDGVTRRCYPIYAVFVGDYPEQVLVALIKTGRCPICPVACEGMGELGSAGPPRKIEPILRALDRIKHGPVAFTKACRKAGIKPVQDPFWKNLPHLNIYESITPDILHQLYQGVLKHVLNWIYEACGREEIDARCRHLPPNHNIRLFLKGITHLSRVTGTKHEQISRFLLGLIVDIRLPDGISNVRLVRAVRGLLDFLCLAKYPIHSTSTLDAMDQALAALFDNLDVFVDLGIREHFDIPKFHFTQHYRMLIELYGTTDNFNTEYTERLHIDMAKDAYAATNRKDEYSQMTMWLERREKVLQHEKFIKRRLQTLSIRPQPTVVKPMPALIPKRHQRMAKKPTFAAVSLDRIRTDYSATQFVDALRRFVAQYQNPDATPAQILAISAGIHLPFYRIPVFHRIKYWSHDVYSLDPLAEHVVDSLHIEPARVDKYRNVVPGRFDVAMVDYKDGSASGVKGYCVAQIRCVFSLPSAALNRWFPNGFRHTHLAYVEWYTPFTASSFDPHSKMYRIKPLIHRGERKVSIIPISLIRQSVQLFPRFGPVAPTSRRSSNVIDLATSFYVNPFSERFQYATIF